jgi:hypothetical protein
MLLNEGRAVSAVLENKHMSKSDILEELKPITTLAFELKMKANVITKDEFIKLTDKLYSKLETITKNIKSDTK